MEHTASLHPTVFLDGSRWCSLFAHFISISFTVALHLYRETVFKTCQKTLSPLLFASVNIN